MDDYLGTIMLWAPNFAPRNWEFCHGQMLKITDHTPLFALLGTMYGGDGRTSFGLPDFRSRSPIAAGQGPGLSYYQIGWKGGNESVRLQAANTGIHTHTATATHNCYPVDGDANKPPGSVPAKATHGGDPVNIYKSSTTGVDMAADSSDVNIANAGGDASVAVVQPYLALNYVICVEGLFPSRN
ncbi:MAG: phage tail protein [Deltaproteobacteria bacterium]|nr:phage tail protein [Deltaproteobacteria bacterium]